MQDDLAEIARHLSSPEAWLTRNRLARADIAACLDGEAMALWGWIFGGAIGGVRLLVREQDVDRAREVLAQPAPDVFDGLDDEPEFDEPSTEAAAANMPPDLLRAWWAAVFGLGYCPPLFAICSMLLLLRHDFSNRPYWDWRVTATFAINLFTLSIVIAIVVFIGTELLQLPPRDSLLFPQFFQQQ
ncbi:MAG: DUF2007 domain-containing protein [Planctomycetes bacterium]|nr:DUF2007 domain-containing protein [Planctomycetota bacterium]